MKIIWLFALASVLQVCCAEEDGANSNSFAEETKRAFEQVKIADFVAGYSTDGKLDIGVGVTHHTTFFSMLELEKFFTHQRHKDMIVVVIAKNVWGDEELQQHVLKLRDYFLARGYKKVVIQQGLGGGRGIHLEHDTKAKSEQAADGNGGQSKAAVPNSKILDH